MCEGEKGVGNIRERLFIQSNYLCCLQILAEYYRYYINGVMANTYGALDNEPGKVINTSHVLPHLKARQD